jgi:hypothetical protein
MYVQIYACVCQRMRVCVLFLYIIHTQDLDDAAPSSLLSSSSPSSSSSSRARGDSISSLPESKSILASSGSLPAYNFDLLHTPLQYRPVFEGVVSERGGVVEHSQTVLSGDVAPVSPKSRHSASGEFGLVGVVYLF